MRIAITLDKEQKPGQQIIDAFQGELTRRVQSLFPLTQVTVKKGSMTGIERQDLIKRMTAKRWIAFFRKYGKMRAGVSS